MSEPSSGAFAEWIRARMPEALNAPIFLLEGWQWIALILLAFAGVVVDRLVRWFVHIWLKKLLARSASIREASLDADFEKPLGILAMGGFWWISLPMIDLPAGALTALLFATKLIVALSGVWAVYRLVDLIAAHFLALAVRTETKVDDILVPLIRRAVKVVVLAFGVLFMAQNLNIDITSLLAGLGIGGLAFALAAKDTVENLFGSVTVLIDRPFQIGDWVVIGDLEGTVEEIGFRSTRIRTFYNSKITVPNSRLVNSSVDNLGEREYRRVKCKIGVQYDTSPDKIEAFCEGIRELIRARPYLRKDYYMVYLNEFADSSLNILLYAFFMTPDWATELRERHRLFVDIVRLAHRLEVEFAFPTQTLHLASVPDGMVPGQSSTEVRQAPGGRDAQDEAIRLGREEARSIHRSLVQPEPQAPVDFADPERVRPG